MVDANNVEIVFDWHSNW